MTLYELQKSINYYYNLKEQINHIVKDLNNTIDNLEMVIRNFDLSYSVDGNSNCKVKIVNSKELLLNRIDLLLNKIIPAINAKIVEQKEQLEIEQMKLT